MAGVWVVVGGAESGGLLVREGAGLSSPKEPQRLSHGAVVQELEQEGERLRYKLLEGDGPETGWVSVRLQAKRLVVPAVPDAVMAGREGGRQVGEAAPAMTFYAISDVHVECRQNLQWLQELPRFERSAILVAGDLGVSLRQIREALLLFRQKFDHVFYCFGNHECWAHESAGDEDFAAFSDSFGKLEVLRSVCEEVGAHTTPQLIAGVWVVPVLGWYHGSWDTEPPLQPPPGRQLAQQPRSGAELATDTHVCKWRGLANGSEALAQEMDRQNELWGVWPLPAGLRAELGLPRGERRPVVSFSHFLPRLELMPEKRFLFQPGLAQVVGSDFVRRRVDELRPDLHVFGHTHFPWDMTLDGVRYRSWPLGMPDEQARRIMSYPTQHTERWHPLPVFDSDGSHYRGDEACWFSLMYTRIPREPLSCRMASYVAKRYCPDAPVVPDGIISHGEFVEPSTDEEWWRRVAYWSHATESARNKSRPERKCGASPEAHRKVHVCGDA